MTDPEEAARDELVGFIATQLTGRDIPEIYQRFGYAGLRRAGRMVLEGRLSITIPGYQLLVRQEAQTKNVRD